MQLGEVRESQLAMAAAAQDYWSWRVGKFEGEPTCYGGIEVRDAHSY